MRVAAYCRVSTDKTDQQHSFVSQKSFFTAYISSRPDWDLTELYADEGITGTTTADRNGFLKMIEDASLGKFDMIITKEVSRFSRNILDAISFTRKLKEMGVGVIFLNDGISTLESDAELRLGIMASVAQEESRKTSERVRWGQMRKMENGVVFGRSLLGYDVKNGMISVEHVGAETIRQIFRLYLNERMGVRAIAKSLTAGKTPTKTGGETWTGAAVLKIIRNEKYCGDLIQRKTVTTNFLTHQKKKNRSEDLIYIRDHHEPIILRAEWEEAQNELKRRSHSNNKAASKGNRYALSGKIICAECGTSYFCRTRKRKDGSAYRVWNSNCTCREDHSQMREDDLVQCVRYITAGFKKEHIVDTLNSVITKITRDQGWSETTYEKEISCIERKKLKLIDTYLTGDVSREEYTTLKTQYENELERLGDALKNLKASDLDSRIGVMMQMISVLASGEDPDGEFYLSLVHRLEVKSGTSIAICLINAAGKWNVEF